MLKFIKKGVLWGLCFWIILISLIDHYLTIKLSDTIIDMERNPIGVFLIDLDGGSVALFMTLKMLFLWVIFGIILLMYRWKKCYAWIALKTLAMIQTFLLLYLLL